MKQATFTPFPADWARSSHFQYYTKGFVKSVNSMTVRMDVTHFLAEVKRRNLKFFPAFAALTGQVIASIPEMCTAVDENGTPGYYSYLNPNFTIFHEDDKTFSDVWSEYDADFDTFYQNLVADAAQYQDKKGIKVKEGISSASPACHGSIIRRIAPLITAARPIFSRFSPSGNIPRRTAHLPSPSRSPSATPAWTATIFPCFSIPCNIV